MAGSEKLCYAHVHGMAKIQPTINPFLSYFIFRHDHHLPKLRKWDPNLGPLTTNLLFRADIPKEWYHGRQNPTTTRIMKLIPFSCVSDFKFETLFNPCLKMASFSQLLEQIQQKSHNSSSTSTTNY
jgi:hypothetical protein